MLLIAWTARFTTRLLAMTSMKFTLADIPKLHHAEWSRIMHKKAEPGQEGGKGQKYIP